MPTILLEQIIELLTGWKNSFFSWANEIGDKIASIKTNTDSLPDIESNTDDIKDNTAAVITPISNINSNVTTISSDVSTIKTDTGIIKNNASAIATSSGQAAAFAEDVANNTLEVKNKITTIASDTTQMRADSGSIRADVTEIKNTLGLYLYNTIVTEDSEGSICNFDTDLQDYLQKAIVDIPSDANGINGLDIYNQKTDLNSSFCFRGLLTGETVEEDLSNCVWTYRSEFNGFSTSTITNYNFIEAVHAICSKYKFCGVVNSITKVTEERGFYFWYNPGSSARNIYIKDSDYNDAAVFRNSLASVSFVYELATPTTSSITKSYIESLSEVYNIPLNDYSITFTSPITDGAEVDLLSGIVKINTTPVTYDSITPIAIRTFKGVNNIYSDIGNTSVTYRETLKHYLEKQQ